MKILVSGDIFIYKHNGNYYVNREDDYDLLHRYSRVFEDVRLTFRVFPINELSEQYIKLETPKLDIYEVPGFHGPIDYLKKFLFIKRALKGVTIGCDCAILRLPSTTSSCVYKEVRKKQLPYATEIVFDAHDGFRNAKKLIEKLIWLYIDKKQKSICYKAEGVSCVTEYYLQKKYYSKKLNFFTSYYSTLNISKDLYLKPRSLKIKEVYNIAHVSNHITLNSRKGVKELIEAVGIVNQTSKIHVNVMFAGGVVKNAEHDIQEWAISKGTAGFVSLVGKLNRTELFKFLQNADLFAFPTKAEGLPRVVIEAMASGLPCISTPVSGVPELLDEEWMCDYSDIHGIAERIVKLLTDANIYNCASMQNYNRSLSYESSILQQRRDIFYKNLKNLIQP